MRCPYCGHPESRVTDSREAEDGIRRRRECLSCGQRFTTYERLLLSTLYVVKRDGRREPFDREKLLAGLRKACEKRPLPAGSVEAVAADIEAALMALGVAEVPSREIGELVMERLRRLDPIAYIRFASVYRRFQDLDELRDEVERLSRPAEGTPGPDQLPLFNAELVGGLRAVPPRRRRGRPRRSESAAVAPPSRRDTERRRNHRSS
jgi:transcriptional repressor NrdR